MTIKELIENGYRVILDTNVLLNIYRYSPEFSEFALECLKAVKKLYNSTCNREIGV